MKQGAAAIRQPRIFVKNGIRPGYNEMGTEIEKKWLPKGSEYLNIIKNCRYCEIEQGYLCTDPVIRVRKEDNRYYMTYKGHGTLVREEYNLPLTKESYDALIKKCEGRIIRKRRWQVPLPSGLTVEMDEFQGELEPLVLFEIEFPDRETAENYIPPDYFGKNVTEDTRYTNAYLSSAGIDVDTIMC